MSKTFAQRSKAKMMASKRQKFVAIAIGFVVVYSLFNLLLYYDFGRIPPDGNTILLPEVGRVLVAEPIDLPASPAATAPISAEARERRELADEKRDPTPTPHSPRDLFSGPTNEPPPPQPPPSIEVERDVFTYTLDISWNAEIALRNYRYFHNTALKCIEDAHFHSQHPEECGQMKYVTYRASPDGGFGNKVRAMMSAFLMALLSGRVFLIDWTVPAHWSLSLAEPPIKWDYQRLADMTSDLANYPFFSWEPLKTENIADLLSSKRAFSVESNSPFYHNILSNNRYKGLIEKVFGPSPGDMPNVWNIKNGPIFETSMLQFLVHPSENVLNVTRTIQEKFKEHYVISLHVRTWDGCTNFKCIDVFVNCGTSSAMRARSNGLSPIIFLAADRQDLVDQLKSRFAENKIPIVLYDEIIKHYVDAAGDSKEQKDRVVEKMMADFYLIGEADLFLGTWYSSFSENAGLRTGVEAFLFGKGPDKDIYPSWCQP